MKTNKTLVASSHDAVELHAQMGDIKFIIDVTQAFLTRDSDGNESLELTVDCRGIGSKGQPLEVGMERTLCVS